MVLDPPALVGGKGIFPEAVRTHGRFKNAIIHDSWHFGTILVSLFLSQNLCANNAKRKIARFTHMLHTFRHLSIFCVRRSGREKSKKILIGGKKSKTFVQDMFVLILTLAPLQPIFLLVSFENWKWFKGRKRRHLQYVLGETSNTARPLE